jgi:hypothetical protein
MAASQTFLRQRTTTGSQDKSEPELDDVASRLKRDEVVWGKTPGGEGVVHVQISENHSD